MDIKGIRLEVADWIHLAQDMDRMWAHVNTMINFQLSLTLENLLATYVTKSFSRRNMLYGIS
jgi:hypothetical protein